MYVLEQGTARAVKDWAVYVCFAYGLTVSLHPPQQPLPARPHKTQHQRRGDPPVPAQDR